MQAGILLVVFLPWLPLSGCEGSVTTGEGPSTADTSKKEKNQPTDFTNMLDSNSLSVFTNKAKEKLTEQIASVTQSTEEIREIGNHLASNPGEIWSSSKASFKNAALVGKVYDKVRTLEPKLRNAADVVGAFAAAVSIQLHDLMAEAMYLPNLEMGHKTKYVCADRGYITHLKTMMPINEEDWVRYDAPEDSDVIDVVIKYNFTYLHMVFKEFGLRLWHMPIAGELDLEFADNEVEIGLEIPSLKQFNNEEKTDTGCFVSLKSFTLTRLAAPTAHIQPNNAFGEVAEGIIENLARIQEDKLRTLLHLGVVKAMRVMLRVEHSWICQAKQLQDKLEELVDSDEEVVKITDKEQFRENCKVDVLEPTEGSILRSIRNFGRMFSMNEST